MNALEARALLFQRKLKITAIPDAIIDSWESVEGLQELAPLKGQLSLLELKGNDTSDANKLAKGSDGEVDGLLVTAILICKALVLTESKERVFSDTDLHGVAGFGHTVLKPLETLIMELSNMTPEAVERTKAFLKPIPVNTSSTSSAATSTVAPTESGQAA